jgi:uncharacterized RDD family membrane protein YckC
MTWQGAGAAGDRGDPGDPGTDEIPDERNIGGTEAGRPQPSPPPPFPAPPPMQPPVPPPPGGPGYMPVPDASVAWGAPSAAPTGLEVPGAPGLRFGGVLIRVLAYWLDAILVALVGGLLGGAVGIAAGEDSSAASLIMAVIYFGVEFLYFVGLWTSGGRATLGMRLMKLQIGNAFDGRTLTMSQAVRRWLALGLPFQALSLLPGAASALGGLASLWALVLLISTAISPTRQGLHDRFANSAIVQPIGASTPALACLLLLVLLLVVVPLIAIVALILLGGQVSTILSTVGTSV